MCAIKIRAAGRLAILGGIGSGTRVAHGRHRDGSTRRFGIKKALDRLAPLESHPFVPDDPVGNGYRRAGADGPSHVPASRSPPAISNT